MIIHPLKQGLKHHVFWCVVVFIFVMIIHPLKQGLKHGGLKTLDKQHKVS